MSRRKIFVATLLALVLAAGGGYGYYKYKPMFSGEPPAGPLAKLTGPTKATVGQQLKYTSEGSVGQDIQFTVSPSASTFEQVKLLDGKDTQGVIYTPVAAGTYYVYLMLNDVNRTAYATLTLQVSGQSSPVIVPTPTPPTVPDKPVVIVPTDKVFFDIKPALKKDRDGDEMAAQSVAQLEALFDELVDIGNKSTTWEQFINTFKDASKELIGDKLPECRKAIRDYMNTRFPRDPKAAYNRDLIKEVQKEILQTIKLSK